MARVGRTLAGHRRRYDFPGLALAGLTRPHQLFLYSVKAAEDVIVGW